MDGGSVPMSRRSGSSILIFRFSGSLIPKSTCPVMTKLGRASINFSGYQYHFNNQPKIITLPVDLDENFFFVSLKTPKRLPKVTWEAAGLIVNTIAVRDAL